MPQDRMSRPRSNAASTIAAASAGVGSASSSASIGPRPRTSPTAGTRLAMPSSPARRSRPSSSERRRNSGSATASSTTAAAAQATGLPPKVPPSPPGATGDSGERQPAADRLPRDEKVGLGLVVLDRPHRAGAADTALHLVVDVEDPVAVPQPQQARREGERGRGESALPPC